MTDRPAAFHVLTATTSAKITSPDELDMVLAESKAESDDPQWIEVSDSPDFLEGRLLSFGIGRDYSFLNFDNAHVPGDLAPDDEDGRWWSDGSQGGISRRGRGIPAEIAHQAAHDFIRTGQRPTLPDTYQWVDSP